MCTIFVHDLYINIFQKITFNNSGWGNLTPSLVEENTNSMGLITDLFIYCNNTNKWRKQNEKNE